MSTEDEDQDALAKSFHDYLKVQIPISGPKFASAKLTSLAIALCRELLATSPTAVDYTQIAVTMAKKPGEDTLIKMPNGYYIFLSRDELSGQHFKSADLVRKANLDPESAVPLPEVTAIDPVRHLAVVVEILKELEGQGGGERTAAAIEFSENCLRACEPTYNKEIWTDIHRDLRMAGEEGRRLGDVIQARAQEQVKARGSFAADGVLVATLSILSEIDSRIRRMEGESALVSRSDTLLFMLTQDTDLEAPKIQYTPVHEVATLIITVALKQGLRELLKAMAEKYKTDALAFVEKALSMERMGDEFYHLLFWAAPNMLAANWLNIWLHEEKEENDTEEQLIRITGSLANASANIDGRALERHCAQVREMMARRHSLGKLALNTIIEREFLYPRSMDKVLTGERA